MALYRAQAVFTRGGGIGEDVAVNTWTFATSDPIDDLLTNAERVATVVYNAYASGSGQLMTVMHTSTRLDRIKVYNGEVEGGALVDRDVDLAGQGGGGLLPAQVACSLTWRTAIRKRWGRVYLPGIAMGQLDGTTGRFPASVCDGLAEALATWSDTIDGLSGDTLDHVTTSRNADAPTAVVSAVTAYQVDNVPDVIRSRRSEIGIYRATRATRDAQAAQLAA